MIVWLQFIACTSLILFSGSKLSFYGDIIAEKIGMGRTWMGVVLMASVTSLPELITGVSSVTIFDLPNIAAGDVLGSDRQHDRAALLSVKKPQFCVKLRTYRA